jgi:hypothetical protein
MSTQESVDAAWKVLANHAVNTAGLYSTPDGRRAMEATINEHRPGIEATIRAEQDAELVRLRAALTANYQHLEREHGHSSGDSDG